MAGRRLVLGFLSLVIIISLAAAGAGCVNTLTGSAALVTQDLEYSDFTGLAISGAFAVDITRGDSYRVSITADDNLFPYLRIFMLGNTLHIGLETSAVYIRTTQRAVIVMPALEALSLSGSTMGSVRGFNAGAPLDIELSGGSTLAIDDITAGDARLEISGASDVSGNMVSGDTVFAVTGASNVALGGSARHTEIEVSGASRVDLSRFPVESAEVVSSGSAVTDINTRGRLDAELSGSSRLQYSGAPVLGDINVASGARLNRLSL